MLLSRSAPLAAALLLGSLSAAPAAAQLTLTRTGGTLGAPMAYQFQGAPFAFSGLLLSFQGGPTPLALLDPLDPRVLGVGVELTAAWSFAPLDGAGQRTVTLPVPSIASLSGAVLYAQGITIPGSTTLVGEVSNRPAVTLGAVNGSVPTPFAAPAGLAGHSATPLANGLVLLAGGTAVDGAGLSLPATGLFLYDPQAGSFSALGASLSAPRVAHTATLLNDGRVLLVGGTDENGLALSSAELVDPAAGTSVPTAGLPEPRVAHTATLLADGRVFVAGGTQNFDFSDPLAGLLDVLQSTRIWNPATGTWAAGPNLPARRIAHAATRLADNRVLVSGGLVVTVLFGVPLPSFSGDTRIYNPTTNSFQSAASFSGGRAFHAQTRLPDGRVLLAGGAEGDLISQVFTTRNDAQVYNPQTNSWSGFGTFQEARAYGQLVVSGDGQRVVLTGGVASVDLATTGGAPAQSISAAALSGGGWSTVGSQLLPRPLAPAVPVDGGRRILTAGLPALTGIDLSAETFVLF